jgi:hypothetical protein
MNLPPDVLQTISDTRTRVRYRFPWWLRPFLVGGVIGITIGRCVYIESENVAHLRHELAHVRQVIANGFIRFYWRYAVEYVRNRWAGMSSQEAYRNISFEREAVAAEDI